jgi:hypothetical protein
VNRDDLFKAAQTGGVKNFYVKAPESFGPGARSFGVLMANAWYLGCAFCDNRAKAPV